MKNKNAPSSLSARTIYIYFTRLSISGKKGEKVWVQAMRSSERGLEQLSTQQTSLRISTNRS